MIIMNEITDVIKVAGEDSITINNTFFGVMAHELNGSELKVMTCLLPMLADGEYHDFNTGDIASMIGSTRSVIIRRVRNLEDKGYISKYPMQKSKLYKLDYESISHKVGPTLFNLYGRECRHMNSNGKYTILVEFVDGKEVLRCTRCGKIVGTDIRDIH
jgi:DNA-binding MarR family transcriptional regulator